MPTRMKPMRTEAGPPVWKAEPELMNRPAPMAPPLQWVVSMESVGVVKEDLHGNHLHVAALQRALELTLVRVDHGNIGIIHAELATLCVVAQRMRLRVIGKAIAVLVEVAHGGREEKDGLGTDDTGTARAGQL